MKISIIFLAIAIMTFGTSANPAESIHAVNAERESSSMGMMEKHDPELMELIEADEQKSASGLAGGRPHHIQKRFWGALWKGIKSVAAPVLSGIADTFIPGAGSFVNNVLGTSPSAPSAPSSPPQPPPQQQQVIQTGEDDYQSEEQFPSEEQDQNDEYSHSREYRRHLD